MNIGCIDIAVVGVTNRPHATNLFKSLDLSYFFLEEVVSFSCIKEVLYVYIRFSRYGKNNVSKM